MALGLSSALNSLHRYMHHPTIIPLSSRRLAAGWLFLISRTAAEAGFCLSPQPPSTKFISSAAFANSPPSQHHMHNYRAAFKSHNKMSTSRSSSNSNTAAAVMIELPTKKWADVFTLQNPNYNPQNLFPPLSSSSHKGSHGRIAILGGSNKYTGAPYYAAQAALNCGVDLATVFCAEEAAIPIKCYSPELMVQGVYSIGQFDALLEEEEALLTELERYKHKNDLITVDNYNDCDDTTNTISLDKLILEHDDSRNELIQNEVLKNVDDTKKIEDIVNKLQKVQQLQESLQELQDRQMEIINRSVKDVVSMFPALHALCVGPGLGRHPLVFKVVQQVLKQGMQSNLTLILDADVLFMLSLEEYRDLYEELLQYEGCIMTPNVMERKRLPPPSSSGENDNNNITVEKGHVDVVSRGNFVMQCAEEGGLKRSGGIGDVLAGTISAYMAWHAILERGDEGNDEQGLRQQRAFAVWTACCTVKLATKVAFMNKRRAMSSRDVLDEICGVIAHMEDDIERSASH
jgi:NAD(P)H-hydrate repair Nnr-like enzyme with NAD(P)H-hydrate dehydratase domain